MTVLPAFIARTSTFLPSQINLANLARTNLSLSDLAGQLSSGRAINRPSDDAVRASALTVIRDRLSAAEQRGRNLTQADTLLSSLDVALADAADAALEARSIASSQIGLTSDPTTRSQQAIVVDSLLQRLLAAANTQTAGVYVFGAGTPTAQPLTQTLGGFRFTARGPELALDLGPGVDIPVTLAGGSALGQTSARLRSLASFEPSLTAQTRLADLRGAQARGVTTGVFEFSFNGGPVATVDTTGADSIADVQARLLEALRRYESDNGVSVLGPGGVSLFGQSLSFDVVAGGTLTFNDLTGGTAAADLGLTQAPLTDLDQIANATAPRLTLRTPIAAIPGLTPPALGSVRVRLTSPGGSTLKTVDLSGAQTADDLRNLLESAGLGVRAQINADGTALDVFHEIAGTELSIEEVPGGTTAARLGIRTLLPQTPITDLNRGRGVRVVDGVVDPTTGSPAPRLNTDLRLTLGNGQYFDVDLRPQDLTTVQGVLDRINAEFAAAVGSQNNTAAPPLAAGDFAATLVDGPNGLALTQGVAGGPISVTNLNNSPAADDLGLTELTFDGASNAYVAQDRARLRVDSLLSDLVDLADALRRDDSAGITVAGESLERNLDRVNAAQALVGTRAQRLVQARDGLTDRTLLDQRIRSELEDLDFAEASVRLGQLQTQLQATLSAASRLAGTSLFDFLG